MSVNQYNIISTIDYMFLCVNKIYTHVAMYVCMSVTNRGGTSLVQPRIVDVSGAGDRGV